MSVVLVSIIVIAILLVAAKTYFQEKKKETINETVPLEKTHEQIVYDRLQEIEKFESDLEANKEEVAVDPIVIVNPAPVEEKKPKAKHKKYYRPKKQQPKTKAK